MAVMHEDDSPDLREVARILNDDLEVYRFASLPNLAAIIELLDFLIFSIWCSFTL